MSSDNNGSTTVSLYRRLLWDTKSQIVVEKFNVFRHADNQDDREYGARKRNKSVRYKAPFTFYAVSRDTLSCIAVKPDYGYIIRGGVAQIANDLYYLIGKPGDDDRAAYIQLVVSPPNNIRATVRTKERLFIFEWEYGENAWVERVLDHSNTRNW